MTLSIDCAQITGCYSSLIVKLRIHTYYTRIYLFNVLGVKVIAAMKTIYCKTLLWSNSVLTIFIKSRRIEDVQFISIVEMFLVCWSVTSPRKHLISSVPILFVNTYIYTKLNSTLYNEIMYVICRTVYPVIDIICCSFRPLNSILSSIVKPFLRFLPKVLWLRLYPDCWDSEAHSCK